MSFITFVFHIWNTKQNNLTVRNKTAYLGMIKTSVSIDWIIILLGRTPLTIYVKSDGLMNSEAVSQYLNEMKDKINKKAYNIVFDSAETGSVVIHIVAQNTILLNEDIMVQDMRDFVERVFASIDEEFLTNYSHEIECIIDSSDTIFDEGNCLTFKSSLGSLKVACHFTPQLR